MLTMTLLYHIDALTVLNLMLVYAYFLEPICLGSNYSGLLVVSLCVMLEALLVVLYDTCVLLI